MPLVDLKQVIIIPSSVVTANVFEYGSFCGIVFIDVYCFSNNQGTGRRNVFGAVPSPAIFVAQSYDCGSVSIVLFDHSIVKSAAQ